MNELSVLKNNCVLSAWYIRNISLDCDQGCAYGNWKPEFSFLLNQSARCLHRRYLSLLLLLFKLYYYYSSSNTFLFFISSIVMYWILILAKSKRPAMCSHRRYLSLLLFLLFKYYYYYYSSSNLFLFFISSIVMRKL